MNAKVEATPAQDVKDGDRIRIPGLIPLAATVEAVRRVRWDQDDPESDTIEITVWPDTNHPAFQQVVEEQGGVANFGHEFAQFMVTLQVTPTFPVIVSR